MTYDPNTPAGRALRKIAAWMLDELNSGCHEVVLVAAPEEQFNGHKIRVVQSQNCRWYMEFNQMFTSYRGRGQKRYKRPRTIIKKEPIRKLLERIAAGDFPADPRNVRITRLLEFIEMKRANHRKRRAAADDENIYFSAGMNF